MSTAWALLSSPLSPHREAATIAPPTVGGSRPQALTRWQRRYVRPSTRQRPPVPRSGTGTTSGGCASLRRVPRDPTVHHNDKPRKSSSPHRDAARYYSAYSPLREVPLTSTTVPLRPAGYTHRPTTQRGLPVQHVHGWRYRCEVDHRHRRGTLTNGLDPFRRRTAPRWSTRPADGPVWSHQFSTK